MSLTTEQELQLVNAGIGAIGAAVNSVTTALSSAKAGTLDPSAALQQIQTLAASFATNDANAEKALDAKFPTEGQ